MPNQVTTIRLRPSWSRAVLFGVLLLAAACTPKEGTTGGDGDGDAGGGDAGQVEDTGAAIDVGRDAGYDLPTEEITVTPWEGPPIRYRDPSPLPVERNRGFTCDLESIGRGTSLGQLRGSPAESFSIDAVDDECFFHIVHHGADDTATQLTANPGGYLLWDAERNSADIAVFCASDIVHEAHPEAGEARRIQQVPIRCWADSGRGFGQPLVVVPGDDEYAAWTASVEPGVSDDEFVLQYVRDSSFQFLNLSDAGRPPEDGTYEMTLVVADDALTAQPVAKLYDTTLPAAEITQEQWEPTAEERAELVFIDFSDGACPDGCSGLLCDDDDDCASKVCMGGICEPPTCNDGTVNADETDVDCGGVACGPTCTDGEECSASPDCVPGLACIQGSCTPHCGDGVMNGNETDLDCGGACAPCGEGDACGAGADCTTYFCGPGGECELAPTCRAMMESGAGPADGLYSIDPDGAAGPVAPFQVECDMTTEGGGWMKVRLDDSDRAVVAEAASSGWDKCDDDAARYFPWIDEATITPDTSSDSQTYQQSLSYLNDASQTAFTSEQIGALRPQLSELAGSTRMVAVVGDNDDHSYQTNQIYGHEVYVLGTSGMWTLLTPGSNGDCGASTTTPGTESGYYLWSTDATQSMVDGDVGGFTGLGALPGQAVLPESVRLEIWTGGGAAFGFEQEVILVR